MSELLSSALIQQNLDQLNSSWTLNETAPQIEQTFKFKNYYECMAFVNAVAWIAHQQNHHPDLLVKYNTCHIVYSTHSAGGLTQLDFNAAQEVDRLSNPC